MFLYNTQRSLLLRLFCLGWLAFVIPGCAKYSPKPLGRSFAEEQELDGIEVSAHTLSYNDAKNIFSRNLSKKDYKVVQVSITNHSDNDYVLHGASVNLNLEPVSFVARDMHLNSAKRAFTWILPGFLLLPVLFPLIYIGIVDGCKSAYANKQLNCDFADRCIDRQSRVYIQSGKTINKVMFIKRENYYKKLTFKVESLHDECKDLLYRIGL